MTKENNFLLVLILVFLSFCSNFKDKMENPVPALLNNYPPKIDTTVYLLLQKNLNRDNIVSFDLEVKHPIVRESKLKDGNIKLGDWKIDSSEYIVKASLAYKRDDELLDTVSGFFSFKQDSILYWELNP